MKSRSPFLLSFFHLNHTVRFLTISLLCSLIVGTLWSQEKQQSPQIIKHSLQTEQIDLTVRFFPDFDWSNVNYRSKKTFIIDFPPDFEGPPITTRDQVRLHQNGMIEWLQDDMILLGTFQITKQFTLEAQFFGERIFYGSFNPTTRTFTFEGLEYVPDFEIPKVTIQTSDRLGQWVTLENSIEVKQNFDWGHALALTFASTVAKSNFYRVLIEQQAP